VDPVPRAFHVEMSGAPASVHGHGALPSQGARDRG
jgi:hypothetical protein